MEVNIKNTKQNIEKKDFLFIKFFMEDKLNFIGYLFAVCMISLYIIDLKTYNVNLTILNLFIFYFCSIGFIYHGFKFAYSNQNYIEQYYKMEKDTFVNLYFNYTKYPQAFLEKYYAIKTFILFFPLFSFFLF